MSVFSMTIPMGFLFCFAKCPPISIGGYIMTIPTGFSSPPFSKRKTGGFPNCKMLFCLDRKVIFSSNKLLLLCSVAFCRVWNLLYNLLSFNMLYKQKATSLNLLSLCFQGKYTCESSGLMINYKSSHQLII